MTAHLSLQLSIHMGRAKLLHSTQVNVLQESPARSYSIGIPDSDGKLTADDPTFYLTATVRICMCY